MFQHACRLQQTRHQYQGYWIKNDHEKYFGLLLQLVTIKIIIPSRIRFR